MAAILNFRQKMQKHEFASISSTVRGRAISSKFSPHRVYNQCTLGNFQKFFLSSKMAAILNFRQKMQKHKFASISLTMREFSTHMVFKQCTFDNFPKIFLSPKMAAISNFCQKCKNTNLVLSP